MSLGYLCVMWVAWRKLHGADNIVDTWTPPEVISKYFSLGQVGNDKFHCPGEYLFSVYHNYKHNTASGMRKGYSDQM